MTVAWADQDPILGTPGLNQTPLTGASLFCPAKPQTLLATPTHRL